MAMVPADLRDYSGQIEKLEGTRHKLVSRGASRTDLYEIDASLAALREAGAANQARFYSPDEARARDYENDGGRHR